MATQSATVIPSPILDTSNMSQREGPEVHHVLLPSEEFAHITVEANAAAENLMKTVYSPEEMPQSARCCSMGILDLEEEGASFQLEPGCEQDFMKMALDDSLSDTETLKITSPSVHTPSSYFFNALSPLNEQGSDAQGSPLATPGSLEISTLTLELQAALRVAELEVAQLHAQVSSKTQHLEMAQKALVEYEDEVHGLRHQLKELSEMPLTEEPASMTAHSRQLSQENFFKDLWRVKSGTHRLRQSLGGGEDEGIDREHQVLKGGFEKLNEQNKQLAIGNEELKAELDACLCRVQEYEDRHELMAEEIGALKKEKTKLKTQLIQAQEELMCVLAETPDADEEVTTYRQRLKESQEQREKLRRDLDCAKAELAALKSEMAPKTDLTPEEPPNEERVLQLREVLNQKLREHPEMLSQDSSSESSDRENVQDAKERIQQLQEALGLALEAKTLLEEKVASVGEAPSEGILSILEDVGELKANFQKERRMALRERTENENLIMNLQQEKEALMEQMEQVTVGLSQLQEETRRVQGELANKRLSAEEFKIKAENRIRELEMSNVSYQRKLAQVREALDLCLEAKRELEIRGHQSDVILSEWVRSFSHARMQEEENFTSHLRRRVESGNETHVRQAALQAIEHLERLQEETHKRVNWSSTSVDLPSDALSDDASSQGDSSRMMSVTAHQLRMLRRDLREVTTQRDEALHLLKEQKETDARRFREIQELQTELNAALDQYETLLPQFHEIINSKKEVENKMQQLVQELHLQDKKRAEMETGVVELLKSCHKVLKGSGSSAPCKSASLMESVLWTKTELEELSQTQYQQKHAIPLKKPSGRLDKPSSTVSSGSSSQQRQPGELKPLMEQLKCMVDKERDLRRYFDSQTEKLSKMKVATEQRSNWIRRRSISPSISDSEYPATEMQLQERSQSLQKLSQKEDEISDLLTELSKVQSIDQEVQLLLNGLDSVHSQSDDMSHPMAQDLGDRLNRLQECASALEEQLISVKSENKQLKAERQYLFQRIQSHS